MSTNQQIQALLLWQQSRGLVVPTFRKPTKVQVEVKEDLVTITENKNFYVTGIEGNQKNPMLIFLTHSTEKLDAFNKNENELFKKMMTAINLSYEDILIVSIKEQTEENKDVTIEDLIKETKPKIISPLNIIALTSILEKISLDQWNQYRGNWFEYKDSNIKIIPTWHPKALLNHLPLKREAWNDLQNISKYLSKNS